MDASNSARAPASRNYYDTRPYAAGPPRQSLPPALPPPRSPRAGGGGGNGGDSDNSLGSGGAPGTHLSIPPSLHLRLGSHSLPSAAAVAAVGAYNGSGYVPREMFRMPFYGMAPPLPLPPPPPPPPLLRGGLVSYGRPVGTSKGPIGGMGNQQAQGPPTMGRGTSASALRGSGGLVRGRVDTPASATVPRTVGSADARVNPISELNMLARQLQAYPEYTIFRIGGKDHEPLFRATVKLDVLGLVGEGSGGSKIACRRAAADALLSQLADPRIRSRYVGDPSINRVVAQHCGRRHPPVGSAGSGTAPSAVVARPKAYPALQGQETDTVQPSSQEKIRDDAAADPEGDIPLFFEDREPDLSLGDSANDQSSISPSRANSLNPSPCKQSPAESPVRRDPLEDRRSAGDYSGVRADRGGLKRRTEPLTSFPKRPRHNATANLPSTSPHMSSPASQDSRLAAFSSTYPSDLGEGSTPGLALASRSASAPVSSTISVPASAPAPISASVSAPILAPAPVSALVPGPLSAPAPGSAPSSAPTLAPYNASTSTLASAPDPAPSSAPTSAPTTAPTSAPYTAPISAATTAPNSAAATSSTSAPTTNPPSAVAPSSAPPSSFGPASAQASALVSAPITARLSTPASDPVSTSVAIPTSISTSPSGPPVSTAISISAVAEHSVKKPYPVPRVIGQSPARSPNVSNSDPKPIARSVPESKVSTIASIPLSGPTTAIATPLKKANKTFVIPKSKPVLVPTPESKPVRPSSSVPKSVFVPIPVAKAPLSIRLPISKPTPVPPRSVSDAEPRPLPDVSTASVSRTKKDASSGKGASSSKVRISSRSNVSPFKANTSVFKPSASPVKTDMPSARPYASSSKPSTWPVKPGTSSSNVDGEAANHSGPSSEQDTVKLNNNVALSSSHSKSLPIPAAKNTLLGEAPSTAKVSPSNAPSLKPALRSSPAPITGCQESDPISGDGAAVQLESPCNVNFVPPRKRAKSLVRELPVALSLSLFAGFDDERARQAIIRLAHSTLYVDLKIALFSSGGHAKYDDLCDRATAKVIHVPTHDRSPASICTRIAYMVGVASQTLWVERAKHLSQRFPLALSPRIVVLHDNSMFEVLQEAGVIDVLSTQDNLVDYVVQIMQSARKELESNALCSAELFGSLGGNTKPIGDGVPRDRLENEHVAHIISDNLNASSPTSTISTKGDVEKASTAKIGKASDAPKAGS